MFQFSADEFSLGFAVGLTTDLLLGQLIGLISWWRKSRNSKRAMRLGIGFITIDDRNRQN